MNILQKIFHRHNLLSVKTIYPVVKNKNVEMFDYSVGTYYINEKVKGTAIIKECSCGFNTKEVFEGKWKIIDNFPIEVYEK